MPNKGEASVASRQGSAHKEWRPLVIHKNIEKSKKGQIAYLRGTGWAEADAENPWWSWSISAGNNQLEYKQIWGQKLKKCQNEMPTEGMNKRQTRKTCMLLKSCWKHKEFGKTLATETTWKGPNRASISAKKITKKNPHETLKKMKWMSTEQSRVCDSAREHKTRSRIGVYLKSARKDEWNK